MKNSKTKKQRILNAEQIKVILERFAREIPRQYPSLEPVVFIGIRTRGPHMAKRVEEIMKKRKGREIPDDEMDVTLYRDDGNAMLPSGHSDHTRRPFDIAYKIVIIFNYVLKTSRP